MSEHQESLRTLRGLVLSTYCFSRVATQTYPLPNLSTPVPPSRLYLSHTSMSQQPSSPQSRRHACGSSRSVWGGASRGWTMAWSRPSARRSASRGMCSRCGCTTSQQQAHPRHQVPGGLAGAGASDGGHGVAAAATTAVAHASADAHWSDVAVADNDTGRAVLPPRWS